MYVSAIKLENGSNICKKNSSNQGKISYAIGLSSTSRGKDNVTFGSIDPLTWAAIQGLKGVFGVLKKDAVINKAKSLLYSDNPKDGINAAIAIADKLSGKIFRSGVDDLLALAASKAHELSDVGYENKDLKQRLLSTTFFLDRLDYNETDLIPKQAKILFKELDNKIYLDFKKYLLTKALEPYHRPKIDDFESLVENTKDQKFIEEIRAKLDKIAKEKTEWEVYKMEHPEEFESPYNDARC